MPRHSGGEIATMDLIFAFLIAEAAAHSLGDWLELTDQRINVRVKWIERLVTAPPLQVVRNGQLLHRNMWREFLTEEELLSRLRQKAIESLAEVKATYVEGEGNITAIKR